MFENEVSFQIIVASNELHLMDSEGRLNNPLSFPLRVSRLLCQMKIISIYSDHFGVILLQLQ